MGLFEILETVALIATLAIAVYAAFSFPRSTGLLLALSILLIASYNVFPIGAEEGFGQWTKHLPVYLGLIGLTLFLRRLAHHDAQRPLGTATAMAAAVGLPMLAAPNDSTVVGWARLLTQEGLQHILVLPMFTVVLVTTIVGSTDAKPSIQHALKLFLFAGAAATLIHVMEFLLESQSLLPSLTPVSIETLEMVLIYKMLIWFVLAIRAGRRLANA